MNAKRGRPSKFNPDKQLPAIKELALIGWTDKQICKALNISESTFNLWKLAHPEFSESLRDWKEKADAAVEHSLYERACGYTHKEDKIFQYEGIPVIVPTEKHYPPDPTSMIFWLKNRKPKEWRDKVDVESGGQPIAFKPNFIISDQKSASHMKKALGLD